MTDKYKHALRRSYLKVRANLPLSYQEEKSHRICSLIQQLSIYSSAQSIALYYAHQQEVTLTELWHAADHQGKYCYFPKINGKKSLAFLPVTSNTPFIINRYGIYEPDISIAASISVQDLDIIFLPLLAFDRQGTRLGWGGGYYDRTLAIKPRPFLIGVAYDFQKQTYLIPERWDVPLDAIVTEKAVYTPNQ